MKQILIIFCILSVSFQALAQDKKKATNGEFWGKSEAYLHKQAFQMFGLTDEALTENPPVVGAPMVRKLALYNLDAMLHETKYDNTEPFNNFVNSRMQQLLVELNNPVKKGLKIFKVYNDGFIARTQSTTIAFDIVRGSIQGKEIVSEEYIKQIVEHCDILFITHNHGDHADRLVANLFVEAGKPVIAPTNIWADDESIQAAVIHQNIGAVSQKSQPKVLCPGKCYHFGQLLNGFRKHQIVTRTADFKGSMSGKGFSNQYIFGDGQELIFHKVFSFRSTLSIPEHRGTHNACIIAQCSNFDIGMAHIHTTITFGKYQFF